ncbi:MAG: ribonucleoprotein complex subunit 4 [Methanofollis sp.]|nr:ribonucleoprotein complex subunit 4 [Methanofollis sp.]
MLIAITRLAEKAGKDADVCARFGHTCYTVSPLRAELRDGVVDRFVKDANAGAFDCIFFTSALPAAVVAPRLRLQKTVRIVAIGPRTARTLEEHGLASETLPTYYSADFAPHLGEWLRGRRIGIPRAAVPNPGLLQAIEDAGGNACEYQVYDLVPSGERLDTGRADAVLFTSASSFTTAQWERQDGQIVVAIGRVTAQAMETAGVAPDVVGDGSLAGTLAALNLRPERARAERRLPGVPGAGLVVVDKPQGPSSHQVAAWVGRMLGVQVGHAGTLDPQVSGVLVVMIGPAARLAPVLLREQKEYVCAMRIHGDAGRGQIEEICREFVGRIYQRPPRRSAVKRSLRIRKIHELEVLDVDGRLVLFRVVCDAGTYIRSLCHHLGLALGTGAHMQELRRTRSGSFTEESAHTLHAIRDACVAAEAGDLEALSRIVLPPVLGVGEMPRIVVRDTAIDAICHGAKLAGVGVVSKTKYRRGDLVAVLSLKDELVCLGEALVDAEAYKPGDTGLVLAPNAVMMAAGTYPRGWTAKTGPKNG